MTVTGSELCDLPLLFKNGNICTVILNYSEFVLRNNGQIRVLDCRLLLQHQEISLFTSDVSAARLRGEDGWRSGWLVLMLQLWVVKLILMTLYSAGICCDPHILYLERTICPSCLEGSLCQTKDVCRVWRQSFSPQLLGAGQLWRNKHLQSNQILTHRLFNAISYLLNIFWVSWI